MQAAGYSDYEKNYPKLVNKFHRFIKRAYSLNPYVPEILSNYKIIRFARFLHGEPPNDEYLWWLVLNEKN